MRISSFVLVSEIAHCPLRNLIRHPALLNLKTERREMFEEGTSIALLKLMRLTAPSCLGDFVQTIAVPRPEEETDPSPKPVILLVSSLLSDLKSDRLLWICDVVPESMIIGVGPLVR